MRNDVSVLDGVLGRRVRSRRAQIRELVAAYGGRNPRVFGSVARGDEHADSDIDVLIDLPEPVGLFTLLRLQAELSRLFGARVEVVPSDSLRPRVALEADLDAVAL